MCRIQLEYQTHSARPELKRQIPLGIPMKLNVSSYWQTNIWETTSGNFATDLLQFHANTIGLDRIMYSVDYPFVCSFDVAVQIASDSRIRSPLTRVKHG